MPPRAFRSGNSQEVRLPKEFRFKTKDVEISRRANKVIRREKKASMREAFGLLAALSGDLNIPVRKKDLPQKRKGL